MAGKKKNFHLIAAVAGQFFYFGATGIQMMMPVASALLSGHEAPMAYWDDDEDSSSPKPPQYHQRFNTGTIYIPGSDYYFNYPVMLEGGILMIPLQGALMQNDYCGRPGLATIRNWYWTAIKDSSVKGILEFVNSPGGSVFGTAELAGVKKSSTKLIYSVVEGLCCSAAQWIAGTSNKTFATSLNCLLGSIGTMTTYTSMKKRYEDLGIVVTEVYPKTSSGKNLASREAEKGNFNPLEDLLFEMDENFMNEMKALRPNASEEALKGHEYLSLKAQENGLLDGIATFQEVYEMLLKDSKSTESETTPSVQSLNSNTTMSMSKVKLTAIHMLAAMGVLNLAKADGTEKNDEDLVSDLQAQFTSLNAENTRLKPFEAQVTDLQGKLTAITKERDEAVAKLAETPAGKPSATSQKVEETTTTASTNASALPVWVD